MPRASIHIKGLRVYARHGVGAQEARVGNVFEVDAILTMPCPGAVATDSIADTINYADVVGIIKAQMAERSMLLEHVAGRIRKAVTAAFPAVDGGSVTVWKLTPPVAAELERVGFTLEW